MPKPVLNEISVDLGGCEFRLRGYYTPGDPGRYSGPPEHCYPSEAAQFEIESACVDSDEGIEVRLPQDLLEMELTPRTRGGTRDTLASRLESAALDSIERQEQESDYEGDDE